MKKYHYSDDDNDEDNSSKGSETTAVDEGSWDDEEEKDKYDNDNIDHRWFHKLALLGDSPAALFGSFCLLLVSVGISLWLENGGAAYYSTNNTNATTTTTILDSSSSPMTNDASRMSKIAEKKNRHAKDNGSALGKTYDYENLGPIPQLDPPHIYSVNVPQMQRSAAAVATGQLVSDEIREAFANDGVVAVRGLIGADLLDRLDQDSQLIVEAEQQKQQHISARKRPRKGTQFHSMKHGAVFMDPLPADSKIAGEEDRDDSECPSAFSNDNDGEIWTSSFLEVAALSNVPVFAAELLGIANADDDVAANNSNNNSNSSKTVRLLRDIFLAKDEEPFHCGFHVDDFGFWPALPEYPGVNAWIALDDMPLETGGSLAVAVGSHAAEWRHVAYEATGAPPASQSFPEGGYASAEDLFSKRTGSGTCNIKTAAPRLHRRLEDTKRVYPVQKGDIIFQTRWMFHRTVPFDQEFVRKQRELGEPLPIYRRYSLRYAPGDSQIPPGYGREPSVLWDNKNGGRTADDVCRQTGPWYPQVWPSAVREELLGITELVEQKLPVAEERRSAVVKEMKPFLNEMAKKQQQLEQRQSKAFLKEMTRKQPK